MIYSIKVYLTFIFLVVLAGVSWADENQDLSPVALKTKQIVEAACSYISAHSEDMQAVQHALQNDSRFIDHKDRLYIFMHCYNAEKKEAVCCGQGIRPELVGRNMWHLRTPNGRLLFQEIEQLIKRDGGGWLEYDWLNPYTNKIQTKRSYVKGAILKDGRKVWIGSGYWKD